MKTLIRSLKYFLKLCVICIAAYAVLMLAGMTPLTPADIPHVLLHTSRGWMLTGAAVLFSALYPRLGFPVRRVEADLEQERTRLLNAMKSVGYELAAEEEGTMRFRAANPLRRLALLFEDEIAVCQYGQWILLEGPGKQTLRAEHKLKSYFER